MAQCDTGNNQTVDPQTTSAHRASADEPENTSVAFRRARAGRGGTSPTSAAPTVRSSCPRGGGPPGWRRRRVAQSTAAELAEVGVPRLADLYAELASELSLDLYDPAGAAISGWHTAGATSGCGSLAEAAAAGGRGARTRGPRALDPAPEPRRALERHAAAGRPGIAREPAPLRLDRRSRGPVPPVRRAGVMGRQEVRHLRAAGHGVDACTDHVAAWSLSANGRCDGLRRHTLHEPEAVDGHMRRNTPTIPTPDRSVHGRPTSCAVVAHHEDLARNPAVPGWLGVADELVLPMSG